MKPLMIAPLLCLALAACGGGPASPSAQQTQTQTQTPTQTPSAVPTTTLPTPPATSPKTTPSPAATVVKTDLPDGRSYAYLKSIDTTKRTLTLDVVQFLTGEAAEKAAQEDGEEAFDYYVRNQNTKLRTLSFTAGVTVTVNTLAAAETGDSSKDTTITLAKLQTYFAKKQAQQRLFHVTIAGGVVTKINEQYLP